MAFRFLVVALLATITTSFNTAPAACCSRLPASRVVNSARFAQVCLCDAGDAAPAEAAAEAAPAPEAEAAAEAPKKKPRANKTPLEELEVGQEMEGKIRSVMSYGAFVDVGAATDALLHVSEISNEFVKDATEKLTAGETVKAKIKAINLEKQQLALTCKDPAQARERRPRAPKVDLSKYEGADEKEFITGKVNSITDFGAFVTLEEGVDGLVHISQVQEGGVGKVSDVLSVGQEVKVRVTNVDKAKRRIGLSMLEWKERSERGGGGGGMRGMEMFEEAPKLSAEELEALTVGDVFASPFEAAFARADMVQVSKAKKERYTRQML